MNFLILIDFLISLRVPLQCLPANHLYQPSVASLQKANLRALLEEAQATIVRYHDDGSKKLNACILSLSHMVYL
jgi:hypothetical protein